MNSFNKSLRNNCLPSLRSRLLESIYSTITNPAMWTSVLQELVACTDSRSARLLVMNTEADDTKGGKSKC